MAEAARKIRYSSYGNVAYDPRYEGNAVRAPGGSEVAQPRVLPRERAAARPRVQVREAGQVSLFAAVGAIAVALFAALVLFSYAQLTTLSSDVVALRGEYAALKTEESRLLAQYELAFDLKSIESSVTEGGRMVKPQESQIFYMDLSGSDIVVVYEDERATATLAETIQNLFRKAASYFQ